MTIYTVHAPLQSTGDPERDSLRLKFIPEQFSFWALAFAVPWLIAHQLWFGLVLYLVAGFAVVGIASLFGTAAMLVASIAFNLLFAMEANTLRRWTFSRSNWRMIDVVAGDGLDGCETRFFDRWTGNKAVSAGSTTGQQLSKPPVPQPAAPGVVGLFSEPGADR